MKNRLKVIEETYLHIFKIVIIVLLSLALIASLVMTVKGLLQMTATPSSATPAKSAPNKSVDINIFLNQLDPKKEETLPKKDIEPAPIKQERIINPIDEMLDKYIERLWVYYDVYQKSCVPPVMLDKDNFIKNFPKQFMKNLFTAEGQFFADSQDKFIKNVLEHKQVIQFCKDRQGKGGVFFNALDWHRVEYLRIKREAVAFDSQEQQRIRRFEREEERRVSMDRVQAVTTLSAAGVAFLVFMSLSMLLIFAKIETNLRGINIIKEE